jgi:hypothetical protein
MAANPVATCQAISSADERVLDLRIKRQMIDRGN